MTAARLLLLDLFRQKSYGFHFYGDSYAGKISPASVYGDRI
nr:DUF927 domain-containing protein [Pseudomonas poae]